MKCSCNIEGNIKGLDLNCEYCRIRDANARKKLNDMWIKEMAQGIEDNLKQCLPNLLQAPWMMND